MLLSEKPSMKFQSRIGTSRVSSIRHPASFAVLIILAGFCSARLMAQVPSVNPNTVFVGDAGNAADTTGYGSVSYDYYMGRHEVTNGEYTEFLNAVAATDPNNLFDARMSIIRSGSSGNYSYSATEGKTDHPVVYTSFYDASRFANWLMNGQPTGLQDASTTEEGFYTFVDSTTISRQASHSGQKVNGKNWVAVANEDEWYKAAYYNPDLDADGGGISTSRRAVMQGRQKQPRRSSLGTRRLLPIPQTMGPLEKIRIRGTSARLRQEVTQIHQARTAPLTKPGTCGSGLIDPAAHRITSDAAAPGHHRKTAEPYDPTTVKYKPQQNISRTLDSASRADHPSLLAQAWRSRVAHTEPMTCYPSRSAGSSRLTPLMMTARN